MSAATNKFVRDDGPIEYTPSSAITEGDVVVLEGTVGGSIIGIATHPIEANQLGQLAVAGTFRLVAASSQTFSIGERLYWDESAEECTTTATGNVRIGTAVEAKASGTTRCLVRVTNGLDDSSGESIYESNLGGSGIASLIRDGDCRCCLIGDSTTAITSQTTFPHGLVDEWKVNWKGLWCLSNGAGFVSGTTPNFAPAGYAAPEANQSVAFYANTDGTSTQSGLVNTSGDIEDVPSLCGWNILPSKWTQYEFTGNAAPGTTSVALSYISRFGDVFNGIPGYYGGDWTDGPIKVGCIFGRPASGSFLSAGVLKFNVQKPVGTFIGGQDDVSASFSGVDPNTPVVVEFTRSGAQMPAAVLPGANERWRSDRLDNQLMTTSCEYYHAVRFNTYFGDASTNETGKSFVSYGHYVERTDITNGFVFTGITRGSKSIANFFIDKGDDAVNGLFHDETLLNHVRLFRANLYVLMFAVNPSHSPYTEWANGGVVYAGKYRSNLEALIARIDAAHVAAGVALPKYLILTPNRNPADATNRPITTYQQWSDEAFALVNANLSRMAVIDHAMWSWNNFTDTEIKVLQPDETTQGLPGTGGVHPNKVGSRAYARFDWALIEAAA